MNIILASSDVWSGNYHSGSKMWVDNISFSYNMTGEKEYLMNYSLRVYPNPTNDVINIDLLDPSKISHLSLLDINGKLVKRINSSETNLSLNMSSYPKGIYFINVQGPDYPIYNTIRIYKN